MKKIEKFLREQKPELLHHQKFLENGTAERAKESGTEQNYNMIDGCVNNNPKKPRIIGNRISVLDRLHIKLEERKQEELKFRYSAEWWFHKKSHRSCFCNRNGNKIL